MKLLYERPKRNRPRVQTLSPYDDRNYGNWIRNFLNQKTTSRKEFPKVLRFFGGAFIKDDKILPVEVFDHIDADKIKFLGVTLDVFPFEYLDKIQNDYTEKPYRHIVTPAIVDYPVEGIFMIKTKNKKFDILTMKRVPPNAFLINITPPIWVQFCPGAVLYTMGALWCNETMKEYDDEMLTITRADDKWVIRMSFERRYYFTNTYFTTDTLLGVYYANQKKKSLWHHSKTPRDNDIFVEKNKRIVRNEGRIELYARGTELVDEVDVKSIEDRVKLKFGGKRLYVPKILVERGVFYDAFTVRTEARRFVLLKA